MVTSARPRVSPRIALESFTVRVPSDCSGGATLNDTRQEGLRRLEEAKSILEQALWAIDQHVQSAKSASEDEIRALLDSAERELERARGTLES